MIKRIAILPARGGSKRVQNKNARLFCGQPMMHYILSAAARSGLFDEIHVSTESDYIASVASHLGFAPKFRRPLHLADDHTPLMPVLRHVLDEFKRRECNFDQVCLLYACAPLIEPSDLCAASEVFEQIGANKVLLAVTAYTTPLEWAFELSDDLRLTPDQPGAFRIRSQDLATKYHNTGTFAFFPAGRILSDKPNTDDDFYGYVLPRTKGLDIDTEEDWHFAELLYRGLHGVS